ncbi:Carboxylic acid reductase [Mycobacteroides salmoniphilum]|uniref:Carboxylic acid reductase n=1 Tax=Mycobacteroides salmoniphilum TaxID=404941 RepID=A0A4V3I0H6_9MYCO|nr:Carboxylic acid reductase [Mycobacteroides salmoniphilum]
MPTASRWTTSSTGSSTPATPSSASTTTASGSTASTPPSAAYPDAGYPIQRIDNYSQWFDRFDTAIRGLPEKQKQHSLLPLLHAYRYPQHAHNGAFIPAIRFREGVHAAQNIDIPHLTEDLIVKYAKDLEQLGLL